MEKLREKDRNAGLKERMKITQLLIIKKHKQGRKFHLFNKDLGLVSTA